MMSNVECSMRRLGVLAVATIWLAACATAGSEPPVAICPPIVAYSPEFQMRAAGELDLLPRGSEIVAMLSDYAVLRDQARACASVAGEDGPHR